MINISLNQSKDKRELHTVVWFEMKSKKKTPNICLLLIWIASSRWYSFLILFTAIVQSPLTLSLLTIHDVVFPQQFEENEKMKEGQIHLLWCRLILTSWQRDARPCLQLALTCEWTALSTVVKGPKTHEGASVLQVYSLTYSNILQICSFICLSKRLHP